MPIEIIKKETKVVFRRDNETVLVLMHYNGTLAWHRSILRNRGLLFFDTQEIKGNLYDLINKLVESYLRNKSKYPHELKLLNFEKPQDDLLDIVKNVYCKRAEFSLSVEYELHLHKEDLFDCKDC